MWIANCRNCRNCELKIVSGVVEALDSLSSRRWLHSTGGGVKFRGAGNPHCCEVNLYVENSEGNYGLLENVDFDHMQLTLPSADSSRTMRGILMGFSAVPAQRSMLAVRAAHSLVLRGCKGQQSTAKYALRSNLGVDIVDSSREKCLKKSKILETTWTRNGRFLESLRPCSSPHRPPVRHYFIRAARTLPGRALSKGRNAKDQFKTLQSSDVKHIEWWRQKVNK